MRSYKIEGVVLKRSNVGECDRLITLFTKDLGKITVRARGVRKILSKRVGLLEPFSLIAAQVIPSTGSIDTLAEVKLVQGDYNWQKYLGRLTLAYQLCEVVDKLTPDRQPHPYIYHILSEALAKIGRLDANWQANIEQWLLSILTELGFWSESEKLSVDIFEYVETLTERPINSSRLLDKLR